MLLTGLTILRVFNGVAFIIVGCKTAHNGTVQVSFLLYLKAVQNQFLVCSSCRYTIKIEMSYSIIYMYCVMDPAKRTGQILFGFTTTRLVLVLCKAFVLGVRLFFYVLQTMFFRNKDFFVVLCFSPTENQYFRFIIRNFSTVNKINQEEKHKTYVRRINKTN